MEGIFHRIIFSVKTEKKLENMHIIIVSVSNGAKFYKIQIPETLA